jgi:hypothetical protein
MLTETCAGLMMTALLIQQHTRDSDVCNWSLRKLPATAASTTAAAVLVLLPKGLACRELHPNLIQLLLMRVSAPAQRWCGS